MEADFELLAKYVAGSDAAFEALVQRYTPLVYSSALRQLRNEAQAADATQAVFVLLSRKGASAGFENNSRGVAVAGGMVTPRR